MDIKTRDYVAAAMTRGEGPFFIMIWEILPNARGPLIVDSCLRVGYVTILFVIGIGPVVQLVLPYVDMRDSI